VRALRAAGDSQDAWRDADFPRDTNGDTRRAHLTGWGPDALPARSADPTRRRGSRAPHWYTELRSADFHVARQRAAHSSRGPARVSPGRAVPRDSPAGLGVSVSSLPRVTRPLAGAELVADLERRFVTVNDDVRVGGRDINILRPRSAEDLISESDFDRDERLPYWAELWPSSTILANFIVADTRPRGRAIELGAGVGLVSIAAAMAGHAITASDYYDDALAFARANAFRNLGREIDTALIDWRHVSPDVARFDFVFASDVLYESRYAPLVASIVDRLLS